MRLEESNTKKHSATIIGAGLGGAFLALTLAKRGYKVDVYERFSEEEIMSNYATARSYNLTFYDFGMDVLKDAGLWEAVKPHTVQLVGSVTQIAKNPPRYIQDKPYYAVQRSQLLKIIINQAKKFKNVTFHFGTNLVSIDRYEKTIVIKDTSGKLVQVPCTVIFGADGVNSQVRAALQQAQHSSHIQEYADWEYKQIHVTPNCCEKLHLNHNMMYAWTRKNGLILAHPNTDNSFSALLILPKGQKTGFVSLSSASAIEKLFKQNYPEFLPIISEVTKALLENPVSNFVTIYTEPWYYKNFMTIIGDAAHGFNPFYGQGVSAAFADGITLGKLIDKYGSDWGTIFPLYQKARKKHTDALATLSKESILQYTRHKKADYASIYNKFEVILYNKFPKLFYPPPYVHIATNPMFAGDYLQEHLKQRKRARFIGIPLVIGLATGIIALEEYIRNLL